MARHYQPRRFFRDVPNRLLRQYFASRNLLDAVPFDTLTETQVDPIYEAWLELPEKIRYETEQDFQDIDELASEGGSKAILDEARYHGEDLAGQFSSLNGFHEHAFWTFLERYSYWRGALAFHHADTIPASYWRKRKNIPGKPAKVDQATISQFSNNLRNYFHTMQGRGRNCKVECYRRDALDYFFAYPEDYAQAKMEWEDNDIQRRSHHPAFEVIFVYSQSEGTLDVFLPGDRKPVPDLQAIFADVILNAELGPDAKDKRVYDLSPLLSPDFSFTFGPESGIADVAIRKLRLKIRGVNERITLEAEPKPDKHAVLKMLDKVTALAPIAQMDITQVGITVTFVRDPGSRRSSTRTFEVSWPNSCSLKHNERDLWIRKTLVDSGIEPRGPVADSNAHV